MTNLLLFLCLPLALPRQPQESAPELYVFGPDGLEFVERLEPDSRASVLPTATRSERVVRVAPTRNGLRFVVAARGASIELHGVSLECVEHDSKERILRTPTELWIAGPAQPPASFECSGPLDLGSLVRRDAALFTDGHIEASWGAFDGALLLEGERRASGAAGLTELSVSAEGLPRADFSLPIHNAGALLLEAPRARIVLDVGPSSGLDRLSRARCRRLEARERRALPELERAELASVERLAPVRRQGQGPLYPRIELGRASLELRRPDERLGQLLAGAAATTTAAARSPEAARLRIGPDQALSLYFRPPAAPEEGRTNTFLLALDWGLVAPAAGSRAPASEGVHESSAGAEVGDEAGDEEGALFTDVAPGSSLELVHFEGEDLQLDIRPTMGPGAAWGDFDGDGWNDLFLVQGGGRAGAAPVRDRLLRNLGDGNFEDVTVASGIDSRGAGMGALFFDAEGDGDLDLFVANYGPDQLYLNDGAAGFRDVSAAVGLDNPGWSAAVIAADADGDADLDLYVTSYLVYDLAAIPPLEELGGYQREDPVEMLPFAFPGAANTFLRLEPAPDQDPPFRYVDATRELGLADEQGRGMQAVFWDFDIDGDQDLYIANDVSFNVLMRNEGAGVFHDVTFSIGLDDPRGGMGLAVGDVDRDGDEDLFLTNWQLEANALYLNARANSSQVKTHRSLFRDGTVRSGLGPSGVGVTSWAPVLLDLENDGDLDLFIANGYTSPDYESTGICVGQPNQLFENDGEGRFRQVLAAQAGPALLVERASRCALACDYDRDGLEDILVTSNNGAPQLLRNRAAASGHWLALRLRGAGPNPNAIGARVTVEAQGERWLRSLRAGSGYLGGNAPELHFGLGRTQRIDRVEVHWPSGRTSVHEDVPLDCLVTLSEP